MSWLNDKVSGMSQSARAATAIALLALGAVGGASATSLTRPPIEMAPNVPTQVSKLGTTTGVVSVKGRIAEVYGDRFVIEDSSGRMMVDAGRNDALAITKGASIAVQGRYDDGQLRASFVTTSDGQVVQVGPRGPGGRHGDGHMGHGRPDRGPGGPLPIDDAGTAPEPAHPAPPPAEAPKQ